MLKLLIRVITATQVKQVTEYRYCANFISMHLWTIFSTDYIFCKFHVIRKIFHREFCI